MTTPRVRGVATSKVARCSDAHMPYRQHRLTIDDLPRPVLHEDEPNAPKSPAPPVVVACWCGMVERMNRHTLDRFTRDIWKRFDHRDLEPLKWAILRRRRILAMQLRP